MGSPVNIDQEVQIYSNMALNLSSLEEKLVFQERENQKPVAFRILEPENNPDPDQDIGMGRAQYRYILQPREKLKKKSWIAPATSLAIFIIAQKF